MDSFSLWHNFTTAFLSHTLLWLVDGFLSVKPKGRGHSQGHTWRVTWLKRKRHDGFVSDGLQHVKIQNIKYDPSNRSGGGITRYVAKSPGYSSEKYKCHLLQEVAPTISSNFSLTSVVFTWAEGNVNRLCRQAGVGLKSPRTYAQTPACSYLPCSACRSSNESGHSYQHQSSSAPPPPPPPPNHLMEHHMVYIPLQYVKAGGMGIFKNQMFLLAQRSSDGKRNKCTFP